MEPITTAAVAALTIKLAEKSVESAFENVGTKVSDSALKWFKSLFYKKSGEPKSNLEKIKQDPQSKENQAIVKAIIENSVEDHVSNEIFLKEILKSLPATTSISNYKNINTGSINSGGGDIHIGDNNGK